VGSSEGVKQVVELGLGEAKGMAVGGGGMVFNTGGGKEGGGAAGFHLGLTLEVGSEVEAGIDFGALGRKEGYGSSGLGDGPGAAGRRDQQSLRAGSVTSNWPLEGEADCRARTQALR